MRPLPHVGQARAGLTPSPARAALMPGAAGSVGRSSGGAPTRRAVFKISGRDCDAGIGEGAADNLLHGRAVRLPAPRSRRPCWPADAC